MDYFSGDSSTNNVMSHLSVSNREDIDTTIYLRQILEQAYSENYKEIELLILSEANYTHREISEALSITRDGVTRRIGIAKEVLGEMMRDELSRSNEI